MADAKDYLIPDSGAASRQLSDMRIPRSYEIAELRPLPQARLHRWAGWPTSPANPRSGNYANMGHLEKPMRTNDPARVKAREEVLRRNQKVNDLMKNWDPLEAEWKQKMNNKNPDKRSKLIATEGTIERMVTRMEDQLHEAMTRHKLSKGEPYRGREHVPLGDLLSLNPALYQNVQNEVFLYLDQSRALKDGRMNYGPIHSGNIPDAIRQRDKKLADELVGLYNQRLESLRNRGTYLPQLRETIQPIEPYSRPDFQGGGA